MLSKIANYPPSKLTLLVLLAFITLLVLVSVSANTVAIFYSLDHISFADGLIRLLSLDEEHNLPTWFATWLLAGAGILALATAVLCLRYDRPRPYYWLSIAVLFLLVSLDEAARLHELTIRPIREGLDVGGLFYYAWVIPGMVLVAILGLTYLRFVLSLPRSVCLLVFASAAIFVSGAIGMEMIGGLYRDRYGPGLTYGYMMITTVEEALEKLGVTLFIYAVLRYIEMTFSFEVHAKDRESRQAQGDLGWARSMVGDGLRHARDKDDKGRREAVPAMEGSRSGHDRQS